MMWWIGPQDRIEAAERQATDASPASEGERWAVPFRLDDGRWAVPAYPGLAPAGVETVADIVWPTMEEGA